QANANFKYYLPYTYVIKVYNHNDSQDQDFTEKYYTRYQIGGNLKKRIGQNMDMIMDGFFEMWKSIDGINEYNKGTGRSIANNPYTRNVGKDFCSFKVGGTYLSDAKRDRGKLQSILDGLEYPLLEKNQFMTSAFAKYDLEFKNFQEYRNANSQRFKYRTYRFSVIGDFVYGLTDKLEYMASVTYEFPYRYIETRYYTTDESTPFIYTYDVPLKFYIDSQITFRPTQNIEFSVKGGYMPRGEIPFQIDTTFGEGYAYSNREVETDYTQSGYSWYRIIKFDTYYLTAKMRYLF
ncbi:MAG: hypothetical protein HZA30_01330, partial [Candidatus Omnitrophica bacterium]|nr:hypothetical protein [Candidatus Omnitrophota bacterium]